MDNRRAHFLTMVGDACLAAADAVLPLEFLLSDGTRVGGTPSARTACEDGSAVDETGYARRLTVDDRPIRLDEVVELTIRSP